MGRIPIEAFPRTEGMSFVTTKKAKSDALKIATMLRISTSEYINRALTEYNSKFSKEIHLYNNVFGDGDIPVKE